MTITLTKAEADLVTQQATLDKCTAALDEHAAAREQQATVIAKEQATLEELAQKAVPLRSALGEAQRQLDSAREELLRQLVIHAAGATMRLHAIDSLEYGELIEAAATKLKSAWRPQIHTPNNTKFSMHTAVKQAVALAPELDVLDTPVHDLPGCPVVAGVTDWQTRRNRMIPEVRQLLAELTKILSQVSPPREAAVS